MPLKKVVYDGGDETVHARVMRDNPSAYTWYTDRVPCNCRGQVVLHPEEPHDSPLVMKIPRGAVLEFDPDDGSERTGYILGHLALGQAHELPDGSDAVLTETKVKMPARA